MATQDEKAKTATELRDLALASYPRKDRFWKPKPGEKSTIRFLDFLDSFPPGTKIVPLPYKDQPFIDYTDQLPHTFTIYKNRDAINNPPSFIHARNHDGECFICDNYYELRRATMIAEAGTEL